MYECKEYISVVILSYNSIGTIESTLNSIYNQTYEYIDLIISDDASSDNTIDIINCWVNTHSFRFRKIKLNFNEKNLGINENFDRAIKMVDTKWVKFIAADDILIENCLNIDFEFVKNNEINSLIYTNMSMFKENNGSKILYGSDLYDLWYMRKISGLSSNLQYKHLLKEDIKFSPTGFMNATLYKELGGIVKSVRNIEDWPLRLLFTGKGHKIYFCDRVTVLYRLGDSVSHSKGCFFNLNHINQKRKLKELLIYPNIPKNDFLYYYNETVENIRVYVLCRFFSNRIGVISRLVNYLLMAFDVNKVKKLIIKYIVKIKSQNN